MGGLQETGRGAWKSLQIPRRLSHTYVVPVITVQPKEDRKVGVQGEQMLPPPKEAVSKEQSCSGGGQLGWTQARWRQGGTHAPTGVTSKIPPRPEMFALSLLPTSHSVLNVTSEIIFVCMTFIVQFFFGLQRIGSNNQRRGRRMFRWLSYRGNKEGLPLRQHGQGWTWTSSGQAGSTEPPPEMGNPLLRT